MKHSALERKLGLRFKHERLLDQALLHPSCLNELPTGEPAPLSYERLEFLGDAVVGIAIAQELFKRCPDFAEGQLTKLRSSLVKRETLAQVARGLDLGQHLNLGKGEEVTGGRDRESNLADAFEALVGAVFLDRGYDRATRFVSDVMREEIEGLLAGEVPEDPKSRLQEWVQGKGGESPRYRLVEEGGPDHHKSFSIEVVINGQVMGKGQGTRKLDAERQAALESLCRLEAPTGH